MRERCPKAKPLETRVLENWQLCFKGVADIFPSEGSFVNVGVYDLTGKLLKTTTKTIISMGEYIKGIYVFKVAYNDKVEKLKVVKD